MKYINFTYGLYNNGDIVIDTLVAVRDEGDLSNFLLQQSARDIVQTILSQDIVLAHHPSPLYS